MMQHSCDSTGGNKLSARVSALDYAGDIAPKEAYQRLVQEGGLLVDVRSQPEWQFVGMPDVNATQGQLATISWKIYPSMQLNPDFMAQLAKLNVAKDLPIFFICRSGGRSLDAAIAATSAGYRQCYNIAGGFEGEPNSSGHRGVTSGWKASNLPWKQG